MFKFEIMNWYLKVVAENYLNFSGRARRKEYWMFILFNSIFQILTYCIGFFIGLGDTIGYIYFCAMIIPSLAVSVRRLHDTNNSGWNILQIIIPVIGAIILFIFLIIEGDKSENKYGENPKNNIKDNIKNKKDNSKANNVFEEEIAEENDENFEKKLNKKQKEVEVKKDSSTDINLLSDNLRELNKLKEDGILTEEEFNE